MIERCAGITTGICGYLAGSGYCGETVELDNVVEKEAEILQDLYGLDVQIRFNSNRESGGAWIIDGKDNCSIGLSAFLMNSKIYNMSSEEKIKLNNDKYKILSKNKDMIIFRTGVDYYNTYNTLSDKDIYYTRTIYKDFLNLKSAVDYLKQNVSGLKPYIGGIFEDVKGT